MSRPFITTAIVSRRDLFGGDYHKVAFNTPDNDVQTYQDYLKTKGYTVLSVKSEPATYSSELLLDRQGNMRIVDDKIVLMEDSHDNGAPTLPTDSINT